MSKICLSNLDPRLGIIIIGSDQSGFNEQLEINFCLP